MSADLLPDGWKYWCESCEGCGTYDERLGGEHFSNPEAECPDCNGKGYLVAAPVQAPAVALSVVAALQLAVRQNSHDMLLTGEEIRACEKALAQAQQSEDALDAKRYRHMRAKAIFQDRNGPGLYWYLPRCNRALSDEDRLDAAIDAAIAALTGSGAMDDDGEAFDHNPHAVEKSIARHNAKKATK